MSADAGQVHEHTTDAAHEHPEAGNTSPAESLQLSASKLGHAGGFVDFDGDGALDKLVLAPHALRDGPMGAALVYVADDAGFTQAPVALLTGDRDFGYSFADVGDVDGDAQRDFAIGAIHGDAQDTALAGSVHVFKGGSRGKLLAKLGGELPASKFGYAIVGGDFNGDGAADIAVGSPFHTPSPALYQSGAVFVHFGPGLTKKHVLAATAKSKGLGWSLAAGDINADGTDDLLISTRPATGGKVLAYFGSRSFSPALDAPDVVLSSIAAGFGKALTVIQDVSGDGRPDVAVGAPNAVVDGRRDTGSVYLLRTPATAAEVSIDAEPAPAERIALIHGPSLYSRFGSSIAAVGDVDADDKPELAIGAPMADADVDDMVGKVFLFAGKDLGPSVTLSAAKFFAGRYPHGCFGSFLAASHGRQLLVGAPRERGDRGAVYMLDLREGNSVTQTIGPGNTSSSDHEHDEF